MTVQTVSTPIKELKGVIKQIHRTIHDSESILFKFSRVERRLYQVVKTHQPVNPSEIRILATTGNIAQLAKRINVKLEANSDLERMVSGRRTIVDDAGRSKFEYTWSLESGGIAQ
jgi:hypothetical protein